MDFLDQTNDGYPGYEVDYEKDEYSSEYFQSGRGQPPHQQLATTTTHSSNLWSESDVDDSTSAPLDGMKYTNAGADGYYQNLKPQPPNLLSSMYSNATPRDRSVSHPSPPTAEVRQHQQPQFHSLSSGREKADQAFHYHQNSQQPASKNHPQHQQQAESNVTVNPINRRASTGSSNRSYQIKEEPPANPLYGSSWLESSDSSLFPRKPKQIVWTDSSEVLLDYYDTPHQHMDPGLNFDAIHHHPSLEQDGLVIHPSPTPVVAPVSHLELEASMKPPLRSMKTNSLPDQYLSEGSSFAGSSYRKVGIAKATVADSDSDHEKRPNAMNPLTSPPTSSHLLGTHGKMRSQSNSVMMLQANNSATSTESPGFPPRKPPSTTAALPGTFTSVSVNDVSNERVNRKLRGTSKISTPLVESKVPELSAPASTAAAAPMIPQNSYQLRMIPGSFATSHLNNLTTTDYLAPLSEPSPINPNRAKVSQLEPVMTPFMPNLNITGPEPSPRPGTITTIPLSGNDHVSPRMQQRPAANGVSYEADLPIVEEPPRPGTVTSVTNNTSNDRVANKIRASMNYRSMGTASVAAANTSDSNVAVEEPPRPGTVTSVINNTSNDRVANKIRASMNYRSMRSASVAAANTFDSDDAVEEAPRPGTVTSITNNTSNDRVANKFRASMIYRSVGSASVAAANTSDSDDAVEEPPRPGTVTSVTTTSNDRVANKIRASMNNRSMGSASVAAANTSDSDDAVEEPQRPGTVTSISNNTNNHVARKIRASMSNRPLETVMSAATASDSDIAPGVPSRRGNVTSIAHSNKSIDRVANKIRASYNLQSMATSSAATFISDVPLVEPSRPGTVTPVAHGSNDRTTNKIRQTTNYSSVAVASTEAGGLSSDSDVAPLVTSRPGTVTSVKNETSNRVATKIRASMANRSVGASMPSDSEEPPRPGTASYSTNDRVANKIRSGNVTRPSASLLYEPDMAVEQPSRAGTATPIATNSNDDRAAPKMRASVTSRPAMAGFASDSDTGGEEPLPGSFNRIARAKDDRVANKIRAATKGPLTAPASPSSGDELEEPPPVAGTMTAVARGYNDRIASKLRRDGSQRRPLHSEEAEPGKNHVTIGAVATSGDDPARAKNRWIQDDLFHDEEETGVVDVDPEEYFQVRAREMAAHREFERISVLRQREEEKQMREQEKAGLLWDEQAKSNSKPQYGDGLVKSKGQPKAYNSQSIRNSKKAGPSKESSYIRRDENVRGTKEDHYEEPSFWDQLDKPTICVGCIIVVAVTIAFIVPIVVVREKGAAPASPPSQLRSSYYFDFQDALKGVSDIDALTNSSSAQFKALNFIVYDDLFPISVDSPDLIQRYVLMVLFYATGGPVWRDTVIPWGSGVDECSWDFVECDDVVKPTNASQRNLRLSGGGETRQRTLAQQVNGTVVGLHLYRAGLLKTLPDEIRHLSHLATLDLAENRLDRSTIPSAIYDLKKLSLLAFENNEFTGTISPSVRNLTQLTYLSLYNNLLTGTLPSTMGLLTNLETFYAFGNSPLKGPFFRYALRWTRIQNIDIANNGFTGSIPTEISRLSRLEVLSLASNSFGGTLPTFLGKLPLQILSTSQNSRMIKGTIPSELGQLTSMVNLRLDSGALTGTIPTELGNLRHAEQINLSQNRLEGTIPSQLGRCTSLTELDLNNNRFSGTIPSELGQNSNMQILYLEYNNLNGSAPQQLCTLRNRSLVLFQTDCAFSNGVACPVPQCCTGCQQ